MKIEIVAIGKLKERYWQEALAEYTKRLSAYCDISVRQLKEDRDDDITREGETVLQAIKETDYVITLEIGGRSRSSEDFAEHLRQLIDQGAGRGKICFVIGGSNGLSKAVSERADEALSFGAMTYPHQMMRVILAEQIYRAFKIMRGEKYHK